MKMIGANLTARSVGSGEQQQEVIIYNIIKLGRCLAMSFERFSTAIRQE